MLAIYKKEVRSYLYSMIGCVMIAVILAFIGFFTTQINLATAYPAFEYSLGFMVVYCIFIIIVPFITMRSIAEERHTKTEQLLFSLPIPMYKIVLAKYFAQLTVFAIPMAIVALYPVILSLYGGAGVVNFGAAYSVWLVMFLLLAAMVAIGMFISSLVENQIIAAVITAGAFFVLYFMSNITANFSKAPMTSLLSFCVGAILLGLVVYFVTKDVFAGSVTGMVAIAGLLIAYLTNQDAFAGLFAKVISKLSMFDRFLEVVSFQTLDLTAIVYYVSIAVVFVFVTVQSVEKRRWN